MSDKRRAEDRAQIVPNLVSINIVRKDLLWLSVIKAIRPFSDFDGDASTLRVSMKRLQI
jgi:hypothetical protein